MATFETLNALNVNGHTETKNVGGKELTYLSWAWAWAEVKKLYPDAHYTIWRDEKGLPYVADPITGYMVFTSVTIDGITHDMWLPVMDGANNAMRIAPYEYSVKNPKFRYAKKQEDGRYVDSYGNEQPEYLTKTVEAATMTDINKTIMRCLVKNLAMFGLGLYIYAGEDLPEGEEKPAEPPRAARVTAADVERTTRLPQATNSDVTTYLLGAMGDMRKRSGLTPSENNKLFKERMDALVAKGMAPDKDVKEYTMQEAQNLVQAMLKVFKDNTAELIVE